MSISSKNLTAALARELPAVSSLDALLTLFRDRLDWPVPEERFLDDLSFDWNAGELRLGDETTSRLSGGVIRQLRPLAAGQKWGVFIVDFSEDKIHRTALREILRGLVPNRRRHAGLAAWHHEDLLFICTTREVSRFTIVHFQGDQAAKAKLASFSWQPNSPWLRTVCEFNLPALVWPDDPADAAAWRKSWAAAFDKEPLTDAFFKRFETVLEAVKADLEQFHEPTPDSARAYSQAQLLLERLVFLYFLQNRGWLNQQRDYLRANFAAHAARPQEFTYYADFLEPLFWSLATPPGSAGRRDGIPFLNGGLFDDDEFAPVTDIRRKGNPPLRIRNATFEFVFSELLDAFNFTVREDTPLSQDIAVDPEMLGKVFESIVLHAESADPDAVAPDKRKATGSYYTPRIVVHFICREALRHYLLSHLPGPEWPSRIATLFAVDAADGLSADELDGLRAGLKPEHGRRLLERLRDIKSCDPAVGSGAFPVGLLHELVNLRRIAETVANGYVDPVRKSGSGWIHDAKAEVVQNSLYGVDIQQQAIEICRLRLWLSLIVDYDLGLDPFDADPFQFRQALQSISQLPNLDMNFRRGDSLLDQISEVPIRVDSNIVNQYDAEIAAIYELGAKLHREKKGANKKKLRVVILQRRLELSASVLGNEIKRLSAEDANLAADWFGGGTSDAARRRRLTAESGRLEQALAKIKTDQFALDKLARRQADPDFFAKLRKLEGADFDSPFNFVWRLDFADIFSPRDSGQNVTLAGEFGFVNETAGQQAFSKKLHQRGGFDLILGNPPFVTARNPVKRELYRERWKRVCSGKYLLICPFFDLSFNLLRPGGQLGFIVSNAFAKREFGQPLVEDFFPTVDVQKIVDCSGLMFPGHGTPTCIIFGRNAKPDAKTSIRVTATLPGGGDLRTQPEQSPLWQAIEEQHDNPGFADTRIAVTDRPRKEMCKWPWNFDAAGEQTKTLFDDNCQHALVDSLGCDIGFDAITGEDELFVFNDYHIRRLMIPMELIKPWITGEDIRNWELCHEQFVIFPYDNAKVVSLSNHYFKMFFNKFKNPLSGRIYFGKNHEDRGLKWWEHAIVLWTKRKTPLRMVYTEISTHWHSVIQDDQFVCKQTAPVMKLPSKATSADYALVNGFTNASAPVFWLKQNCYNKNAGDDEDRDRFVFNGSKVETLPIPTKIADALRNNPNVLSSRLTALSQGCWERGRQMPALALKKLFEKDDEAYHDWNVQLPGHTAPDPRLGAPFANPRDLRNAFNQACGLREQLRSEMIALQEEMDWLVYEAYGLIGNGELRMANDEWPEPLAREQRPFVLWERAEGDFAKAAALIPADWSDARRTLWRARLECIRDNEHIRRIEQPVYKRRWDEQWKVGNRWACGPAAYAAEFAEAFDGWLSEKAEHWLENLRGNEPATPEEWTLALGQDARVHAAWQARREIVAEAANAGHDAPTTAEAGKFFVKHFRELVNAQTVPDNIPWGVSWDELAKRGVEVPKKTVAIRGKLNVPRERFRLTPDKRYRWAGEKQQKP